MNAERNERLIGESSAILEVQERVSRLAPLQKPVLIVGERGTGKELIASRLHYLSDRWGQPLLKLNCAAISESLLDSELFGHEVGAFSGATKQHRGYFERADGGTLFLDELATTSQAVQEKILRVIEYGEFSRLGGDKVLQVDVRLVAATNGDLPALARKGKFRADLLDRLAFDVITLPPLRARTGDVMLLAESFAVEMVKNLRWDYFPGFSGTAMQQLQDYPWPGNIRELKNVVERAVYRSPDPELPIEHIVFDPFASPYRPLSIEGAEASNEDMPSASANSAVSDKDPLTHFMASKFDFKAYQQEAEVKLLRQAYIHCQFNQRKTAEFLGLTYHQLRSYFRKYDLA